MKFLICLFASFIALGFCFPVDILDDDKPKSEVMESVDKMVLVVKDDDRKVMLTDVDDKMTIDMVKLEPEMDKNDKTIMIDNKDDTMMVDKPKIEDSETLETSEEKEVMIDDDNDEEYYEVEEKNADSKIDDVKVVKKSVDAKDFRRKCNKPFKKPVWCTTTTLSTTVPSTVTTTSATTSSTTSATTTTTTPTTTTTTIAG
ncbi:hypothetical protein PVAND_005472 [Polypedilum vanderplanki]|uniref:Uncharacterized protein n=1 Tax=Polypedilum vanderplanki TaxID=319348 RepID=A0A9J6C0Q1_POLVA|nr:hypothetical protein PVAND_005472 [Polypedilum vanderplanki]